MSNDPQNTTAWQRRLEHLGRTIDDVATSQGDLQAQIDELITVVERLKQPSDPHADGGSPRPTGPPPLPRSRPWLRPVSRIARAGVRATLGVARRAWDVANPRPPWTDQVRVQVGDSAGSLPSLAVVVDVDETVSIGQSEEGGTPVRDRSALRETLCRVRSHQTDAEVAWFLWSRSGETLHTVSPGGKLQPASEPTPATIQSDYLWTVTIDQLSSLNSSAVELAKLGLAYDRPCFLRLDDRVRSLTHAHRSTMIVQTRFWHPATGIDLVALRGHASKNETGVIGRDSGGTPYAAHTVAEGNPFRDAAGPILRRVGRWWIPARAVPRNYIHSVQQLPTSTTTSETANPRTTVLVVLAVPLVGGCERQVADLLEAAADDIRIILVKVVAGGALAEARWQMLAARAEHAYQVSAVLPSDMYGATVHWCARRWQAQTVVVLGKDRWVDEHATDWLTVIDPPRIAYLAWDDLEAKTSGIQNLKPVEPAIVATKAEESKPGAGATLRASLGISSRAMVVGYRADLVSSERPEDFIMVANRLRHDGRIVFLLAGHGPQNEQVADLIGLLPPSRLFRAPAGLPVETFLAACDVVCSTAETRPVVVTLRQTAAAKRPIVATNTGSVDQLLDDGPCGLLVESGDVEGLAAALTVMIDPAVRAAYASAGPAAAARCQPTAPHALWRAVLGGAPPVAQGND